MIDVVIVDASAEARSRLVERIGNFQKEITTQQALVPQLSLKPVSLQEVRFVTNPAICIIGAECLTRDLAKIASIRKTYPNTKIIAEINQHLLSLLITEQMARLGVDDTISDQTLPGEFFRKIILLMRKNESSKNGKLIVVDAGKGGVGVTSIVAGLSETLVDSGKKVVAVDLDSDTQDLSRFLQVKPYINENLLALLVQERPVLTETVEQCVVPVWEDVDFSCVTAIPDLTDLGDPRSNALRIFLSFFESLDRIADVVVVDVASARGALRQALYRVADKVIFVVNNDPATLYASVHRISLALSVMGVPEDLILVENNSNSGGLPSKLLREELQRAAKVRSETWCETGIPFCKSGGRWPASGATLFGQGKSSMREALMLVCCKADLIKKIERTDPSQSASTIMRALSFIKRSRGTLNLNVNVPQQKALDQLRGLPEPKDIVSNPECSTEEVLVGASEIFQF